MHEEWMCRQLLLQDCVQNQSLGPLHRSQGWSQVFLRSSPKQRLYMPSLILQLKPIRTQMGSDIEQIGLISLWATTYPSVSYLESGLKPVYLLNQIGAQTMGKTVYDMVFACTAKRGIGINGKLPWNIPRDMAFFKQITTKGSHKNSIILGRKTFQSMRSKPLPGRINVVVSRSPIPQSQNLIWASSLSQALQRVGSNQGRTFVIGGQRLYQEGIQDCRYLYQTRISNDIQCDKFIGTHDFPAAFVSKTFSQNDYLFDFCQYYNPKVIQRKNVQVDIHLPKHQEYQYTDMIANIIQQGQESTDRTNTGTIGTFGNMAKYDLSESFPLLTTKKIFWKGIMQELLWFIKGSTNNHELRAKKVHIWDGNGSREYLDSIGLNHREQGDLGPVYGFQWRHWGAAYTNMHSNYQNQGVDQLNWLVNQIKQNPSSRRLIMSAWNPSQLKEMALPPCHVLCQFNVTKSGKLNCAMYQRSCDFGLGVPFNIASYSLLTCLIAKICGLKRGTFTHMMGDTHIYKTHIEPLKIQNRHIPYPFPQVVISDRVTDINDIKASDIQLKHYRSHSKVAMKMAV